MGATRKGTSLGVAHLEGRLVCAAYVAGAPKPAYFILLDTAAGLVTAIRHFRYVPYIAAEAELEILT